MRFWKTAKRKSQHHLYSFFIPLNIAILDTSATSTTISKTIQSFPWWVYLLFSAILLTIFYLILKHYIQKKSNKTEILDGSSTTDPITIQKPISTMIIPGNDQHIGTRAEQQDAFAFSDLDDQAFIAQYGVLAVVADGMGGLIGGKEASQLAVHAFLEHYLHSAKTAAIPERLREAAFIANEAVLQFARKKQMEESVGTTLIATVVLDNQLYWLSVGDSRIYLKKGECLTLLTTDHIYGKELAEKVARGEITAEEAENDPEKASLTSFIGLKQLEMLDVSSEPIPLNKGDSVVLCSDGLYDSITTDEMLDICRNFSTQEAAEALIQLVLSKQKPNQDNATVALLTIE
ncbi:protein phosphatase [Cytobacillus eiseniae]|uniref:Protein phosphatase n=1 Tax=Cytobacillus eiseniae TaxID=762947 RepID=A0ABS4RAD6_9BACI|nr:protein phosphatase 2C domain-containing protein [Cytobacillus eiseniae]MBP2239868.1 protein phosphatase [Cytobacillus eiseniae]